MMKAKQLPSKERLHEVFEYRDGVLYSKLHGKSYRQKGSKCGSIRSDGYIDVSVDNKKYLAHRVIAKMHNMDCSDLIDHINGNRSDNRIENLRPANKSLNAFNMQKSQKVIRGVNWDKNRQKWMVSFGKKTIGRFDCMLDAIAERMRYNRKNGYTLRHGR